MLQWPPILAKVQPHQRVQVTKRDSGTFYEYVVVCIGILIGYIGTLCITAGYHRLWTHKSYKAKLPLRIFYMIGSCINGQRGSRPRLRIATYEEDNE
ncbi:hypothetical protein LAZ67_15001619 [Cordylochernes scorpioides]|uniref:Uncharacterized protein n=1 Tax=Cordylochernes scorpioides TaxID=51811 RepID=A0ABY6L8W2_9ARAC|nr:hypothetical protein LAZ67_15001619 [Cordylochernes scorpioides]